jgi:hypothetical protein
MDRQSMTANSHQERPRKNRGCSIDQPFAGILLIAYSANAVMVRPQFTPGLAAGYIGSRTEFYTLTPLPEGSCP